MSRHSYRCEHNRRFGACPQCQPQLTTEGPTSSPAPVLGCEHGRPPGRICPHCLGINSAPQSPKGSPSGSEGSRSFPDSIHLTFGPLGGIMLSHRDTDSPRVEFVRSLRPSPPGAREWTLTADDKGIRAYGPPIPFGEIVRVREIVEGEGR